MNVRRMKDGWTPVFLAATFGTSQVVRWVSGSQSFRFRREFQVCRFQFLRGFRRDKKICRGFQIFLRFKVLGGFSLT